MTQYNKIVQCCYRNSRQCIFCRLNLAENRISSHCLVKLNCTLEWVSGILGYKRNIGGKLDISQHSSCHGKTSIWSLLSASPSLPPQFMDFSTELWCEYHTGYLQYGESELKRRVYLNELLVQTVVDNLGGWRLQFVHVLGVFFPHKQFFFIRYASFFPPWL